MNNRKNQQVGREEPHHSLVNRLRTIASTLEPPLTSKCCIYKVPQMLRKVNEDAYTPQIISIGPFHHGKNDVQMMEKHKARHLCRYIQRVSISLVDLVSSLKECEQRVRRCYAETIEPQDSDDFVYMILLDGGFIIEYLLLCCVNGFTNENDTVLYKPWMVSKIQHDLILLENQLPFFILEKLYNIAFSADPNYQLDSFLKLAIKYLSQYMPDYLPQRREEINHFTDLVRKMCIPLTMSTIPSINGEVNKFSYSAVELHAAGVKFKVGSSKCWFDITLKNGRLTIPHFFIHDHTESLSRNMMALEQCHYPNAAYICEFIVLMDTLINTEKDVELLVKKGIILNWLGSNDALASLFNTLCLNITIPDDKSYFDKLCNDLTEYYENPWHKWKAILMRDYFSTPWRVVSIFAAFTLLVLTLIQTINSFK